MKIKTRLTEKDYINVSFVMFFHSIAVRIIIILGLFVFAMGFILRFNSESKVGDFTFLIIFVVMFPLLTYFNAKRFYKGNPRLGETIEYQFEQDRLLVIGESFSSQYTWEKIYKVKQVKNWVLIYHSKQMANIISKKDLWPSNIDALKEILDTHKVKNNL